jgi:hypothetical protein
MSALFFTMGGFLVFINLALLTMGFVNDTTPQLLALNGICLLVGAGLVGRGLFLVVSTAAHRGRLQRSR